MAKALLIEKGQKFGRWTIIEEKTSYRQPNGKLCRVFLCKCDCGKESLIKLGTLRNGKSRSCGCYMREVNKKAIVKRSTIHGNTSKNDNEYKSLFFVWNSIKQRCYNQNSSGYYKYGAKGIKVCSEWVNNFIEFRDWSIKNGYYKQPKGTPFKDKLSIDRIDPNKNYSPDNCQWITVSKNTLKRHNKL